jgi:hypothetical protein
MLRRFACVVLVVALAVFSVGGCASVLGDFEISTLDGGADAVSIQPEPDGGLPASGDDAASGTDANDAQARPDDGGPFYDASDASEDVDAESPTDASDAAPHDAGAVPSAPTAVTAKANIASGATISWTAPTETGSSPISGYTVTASTGPSTAVAATSTTATITGLTPGTSVSFAVTATNAAGASPPGTSAAVVIVGVPSAPTAVVANANVALGATVSWVAPNANGSSLTGYTITSNPAGASGTAGPTATSAVINGLTEGTTYVFLVSATNAYGTGPAGDSSGTAIVGVPTAPTSVSANANVADGATITWSAPTSNGGTAVTGYTVIASGGGGQTATVSGSTLTAKVTGLTPGQSYTFSVTATNAVGTGPAGVSGSVTAGAPPATPQFVFACPGTTGFLVSWQAVPGATGYKIYLSTTSPVNTATATVYPVGRQGINFSDTTGTTYYFVVSATNSFGESAVSSEGSVLDAPSTAASNMLVVSEFSSAAIEVWDGFSGLTGGNPTRTIQGANTGISRPLYGSLYVSAAFNTMFVSNSTANTVGIFANASTTSGNVAPARTLSGASTGLSSPHGLVVDSQNQFLYVVSGTAINVYANACGIDGNVAPMAVISGSNTGLSTTDITALSFDPNNQDLYVANYTNVLVFHNPSSFNGATNVAPTRTISIAGTTVSAFGVYIDPGYNDLFVSSRDTGAMYVISDGSAANGAVTPANSIINSGYDPMALATPNPSTSLCMLNDSATTVDCWATPSSTTSTTPTRTFTTTLASPFMTGIFIL